jgi:hypothetical protein
MRTPLWLSLLGLCAALVAALAASPARAITVEAGHEITMRSESVVMLSEGGLVTPAFTCEYTLVIDIEESIEVEEVIGDLDDFVVNGCTGGMTGIPIRPFDWDIVLIELELTEQDEGELFMTIRNWRYETFGLGGRCQWEGHVNFIGSISGSPLVASAVLTTTELTLRQFGGSILCPPRASPSGVFELDPSLTLLL